MNTDRLQFVETESAVSVAERKTALRAYMKKRRGENENRDVKEALLLENFIASGAADGQNFFVYLGFSSEAPTDKLIDYLISSGKRVYCPRTEGKEMYAVPFGEDFTLSPYGIREPVGERYDGEIDVVVLPLLAADEKGARLGYGGGYYDRFLKKYEKSLRVAYCFDFQVIRSVPEEEGDERVRLIVTDKRIIKIDTEGKI